MKTLAYTLFVAFATHQVLLAQNAADGRTQALPANEPVMFTLTIDQEMVNSLRDGQSLLSTIPASIQGQVDRIRIEFQQSTGAAQGSSTARDRGQIQLQGNQSPTESPLRGQTNNEPVMFTLIVDDVLIQGLHNGMALMSTIPSSIRGNVDRIRIEFKPSTVAATGLPSSQGINSILNRGSATDQSTRPISNSAGELNSSRSGQPPLQPPNFNTGLERSNGAAQQNLTVPNLTDSVWNRESAPAARSSNSLTPIDPSTKGWLFQNRSDSNAMVARNPQPGGIQTSQPSGFNYPLNRTSFEDSPRSEGLYSGPPIFNRSLPALDAATNSAPITSPSNVADNTPWVGSSQVLSKPPASETNGGLPLAANDTLTSRQDDRTQVYMFMLLLCSLGLNVYLGWISRGFYVRYQELAGELRETFTPGGTV